MATQDVARLSTNVERVLAEQVGPSGRKLSIPRLPTSWVPRARLDRLIDGACERQLVVVTGPPGGGKTSALASWAAGRPRRRVAWASFDHEDGTRERFWWVVVAALHESWGRRPADGPLHRRARYDELAPAEAAVRALEASPPCVLVLDDLHVVREPDVLRDLGRVLRRLPGQVTVVVAGRTDPPVPFARLCASGEVAEIGYGDLRLTPAESEALLSAVAGRPLGGAQLERVLVRTQGWPAAVRLAALQIRAAADPAAAVEAIGTDSAWMSSYVEEELLGGCSEAHVRFLRRSALVDRLTPELCAELTGEPCSDATLAEMAGEKGLLEGDRRHGYRFHPLVAEVLRAGLLRDDPAGYEAGHLGAARYYEREGVPGAAVRHLEAAGDRARALEIAAEGALGRLRAGTFGAAPAFLGRLRAPSAVDGGDVAIRMLAGAMASVVVGEPWEATQWLRQSEAVAGDDELADGQGGRRRALLAAAAAALSGDLEAMRDAARTALANDGTPGPPPAGGAPPEPAWLRALDGLVPTLASTLLARAHLWLGEPAVAEQVAAEACRGLQDARATVVLDGLRAAAMARTGRLREAGHLARATLRAAEARGLAGDPATLEAELALGWVQRERGELGQSRLHLAAAARRAQRVGNRPLHALTEVELVPTLLLSGDLGTAFELLVRHRRARSEDVPSAVVEMRLDVLELEWRLAAGDAAGAASVLRRMPPERRSPVLAARVELLAGRPARALARLDECGVRADATVLERTEHLVVAARAAYQSGALHRARDAMHRALELGRPEELVRPFLENGHEVAWLLRSLQSAYPDPYLERVRSALLAVEDSPQPVNEVAALVEGLTEREREALSRLPTHLTQQQIAAELYVSVNTLKTHLKGLYRKLGATSRAEAVAAARLRGLV